MSPPRDEHDGAPRALADVAAGGRYRIQALDRALGLLELVAERPDLSLQALSQRSGTSPSQVLKILATFEHRGLVRKGSDKTYRLGHGALRLGHQAARLRPVVQLAATTLDALRESTGESIHLVVRDGLDAVIADVRESIRAVRVVSPVGNRTRLNAGSSGKVFLAFEPSELMDWLVSQPLPTYTELSETDPELLRIDVARVRRQGVCVSIGDFEQGAFSVAAPVFEGPGRVAAAIALAGPLSRFDSALERRYRSAVRSAAEAVSERFGPGGATAAAGTATGTGSTDAGSTDDPGTAA